MYLRKKSLATQILKHLSDESYHRHNLFYREYTADVVEHWIRYHFGTLRSLRDAGNIDAICVYNDLVSVIKKLPSGLYEVVRLIINGHSMSYISEKLNCNASRSAKMAYREIAKKLSETENDTDSMA